MNERIKQLLVKAHLEAEDPKDTNWIANRFAELILEDVMDICKAQKWQCGFQSYRDGINDVMHKVMFQFGVKR